MTYIDYLNQFNQWLETNTLPASSQLMYFRLLGVFNRAGWPEEVEVDNRRLQQMIDSTSEKTAIRARNKLVEAGFLSYQKGHKGKPNRYTLSQKHCKIYSTNDSISDSVNDSINASINDSISDSHIKNKNKTKTKTKTEKEAKNFYGRKQPAGADAGGVPGKAKDWGLETIRL